MSPRNNLEFTKNDSQEKAKKKRFLKAAVGTVAAGAVVFGITGCSDGDKDPSNTGSTTTATGEEVPGNTSEQPGNNGGDTSGEKTAENGDKYNEFGQRLENNGKPIDSTSYTLLEDIDYLKLQEWTPDGIVEVLDNATLEEFERYPLDDRVQWAAEKEAYFGRSGKGALDFTTQPLGTGNKQDGEPYTSADLNIAFKPLTKTSSANDIVLHRVYMSQLRAMQPAGDIREKDLSKDHENANKLLSGIYGDTSIKSYQLLRSAEYKYPEITVEPDGNFLAQNTRSIVDKPIETKEAFDGIQRPHRKIVYSYSGNTYKSEWVFVPYKQDIDTMVGVEKLVKGVNGSWVIVDQERVEIDDF